MLRNTFILMIPFLFIACGGGGSSSSSVETIKEDRNVLVDNTKLSFSPPSVKNFETLPIFEVENLN